MIKKVIFSLIINIIILPIFSYSQCPLDKRSLTEIVFQDNATIFSCTVLTSVKVNNGNIYSTARVKEVFLGTIKDSIVKIYTGNTNASEGKGHLLKVNTEFLYYGSSHYNNLICCNNCDTWSKEINDANTSKEEIKLLRKFSEIFKKKKSGKYTFYWKDSILVASGIYSKGKPIGDWLHYDNKGKLICRISFPISNGENPNGFTITQIQAIEIAKKNGFLHDAEGYYINADSLNWIVTIEEASGLIKTVKINAKTGEQSKVALSHRID